jgi:hypothetical protein
MTRLLDHLVTVGVLEHAEGRYRTTPSGDQLELTSTTPVTAERTLIEVTLG